MKKITKLNVKCPTCNEWFETYPATSTSATRTFCSRFCFTMNVPKRIKTIEERKKISESRIGKKNPMYKGGTTDLKLRIRSILEYKIWRTSVFERDNFTCCSCGNVGGSLNAHHIKSFAQILQDNNIKTLEDAINCSILWDISNGVTLCVECHKLTDNFAKNVVK